MMNKIIDNGNKTFTVEYWDNGIFIGKSEYQCIFYVLVGNTNANRIILVSSVYRIELSFDTENLEINGNPVTDVNDAFAKLKDFVSSAFSEAGGAAITTFEPNEYYKSGELVIYDGEIWVAKFGFMSGADFNPDDWDQISVGTEELSEKLDKKLDKVATANKLYGTDELGEQEEYDVSYFEKSENKTDTIRDTDEADDVKFPTEKATRTELNKKADKIVTPHIDWNPDSFNVSAGRTLQFNEATTPTIVGEDMPILAYYSEINGNPDSMFGFFSNDGGATTQFGKFHLNNDASAFVDDVLLYDGTTWLNGGHYVLSDDIAGDFDSFIGNNVTVAGFDLATDITVLDVPDKNLIDIENEILQLVISKANIYVRLAQGITTGNNIQGMHIAPKPPFAYFTDWTLTASDGATIVRTDNSLIYNKSNGSVVTLVDSGNILISDYVLEDVFLITEMAGSFTNVNLFYRYFDLKDYDQRIGLLSALQTVDKSSIVNAINSLKSYVDGILSSSEVAGSPYASYADFMSGAGATITPSKYAYVTFTDTDVHPSGGNWDKIVAGETWRLDCSDTAWLPTSNMTAAMTSNVLDESATNVLKAAGSDTVTSWLQSFRNNLKSLFASITSLSNDKQDKLTSTGSTNVLTAPATAGGQPGTKAIADFATPTQVDAKQNKITATGATNLLVAPTEAGGQPGTKSITDFATPSQVAAKQDKITAIGATNLLVAPAAAGGQLTTKAISDFVEVGAPAKIFFCPVGPWLVRDSVNTTANPVLRIYTQDVNNVYISRSTTNNWLAGFSQLTDSTGHYYLNIPAIPANTVIKKYNLDGSITDGQISDASGRIKLGSYNLACFIGLYINPDVNKLAWIYSPGANATDEYTAFRVFSDARIFPIVFFDQNMIHVPVDGFVILAKAGSTLNYVSPQIYGY